MTHPLISREKKHDIGDTLLKKANMPVLMFHRLNRNLASRPNDLKAAGFSRKRM
jgi:hypothetical protein